VPPPALVWQSIIFPPSIGIGDEDFVVIEVLVRLKNGTWLLGEEPRNDTENDWRFSELSLDQVADLFHDRGVPPPDSLFPASSQRGAKKRPGGRPSDTSAKEDRRIAEAWETGRYASYEALAQALGKTKREVSLAIDRVRHRKRAGKPDAGKPRQDG
jgi:hypothetical protein